MLISRSTAYLYDICAYYLAACTHDPGFQYSCRTNPRSFAKRREKFVTSPFFLSVYPRRRNYSGQRRNYLVSLSLFLFLRPKKERCLIPFLVFFFLVNREWSKRVVVEREGEREVKNNVLNTLSVSAIPYADSSLLRGRYVGN